MSNEKGKDAARGSQSTGKSTDHTTPTSGSREESMNEAGKDQFGKKPPPQAPAPEDQGDGTSDDLDETPARDATRQNPASSGTTSLGGEPKDAESIRGPGGIEGTG
ncbi:MAG: hypothetical protein ABIR58_01335 [Gemmatimonadaceae bacterium]